MNGRRFLVLVGVAVIFCYTAIAVAASDKPKPNYKVSRLSVQDVAVSCNNGQKPELKQIGNLVLISCDAE